MKKNEVRVHCNRDYKGFIDIRSHVIDTIIRGNKSVTVTCGTLDGISHYTIDELKNPVKVTGPFTSKYKDLNPLSYYLNSYKWKGTNE
jgi:hypothetical protein